MNKNLLTHAQLTTLATRAAVIVAAILVVGKFIAWWMSNSLSLKASLLDSLLDVGASLLNMIAVKHALRPADEEHRFGHGKFEALASLGQSAFIAASALWLVVEAIHRIFDAEPVTAGAFGNAVMVVSMIMTAGLVLFQRYVYEKTHSLAIKADSLHYQTDFLTSIGVLISLNVSAYLKAPVLDVMIGGGIAFYIAYTSWEIFKKSFDILTDRQLDDDMLEQIKSVCRSHPKVLGVHDLRTRSAGHHHFIQMHLDLDAKLSLLEAHHIAQEVTHKIRELIPRAEVIIHQDPYGHDDEDFHP